MPPNSRPKAADKTVTQTPVFQPVGPELGVTHLRIISSSMKA